MLEQVKNTTEYIKRIIGDFEPEIGIILGTGLGGLVQEMEVKYELLYSMIPDFPIATVEFHTGKLIFGTLAGKNIIAMNGRFHYYEGYSMKEITFPVRVMKLLGIQKIIISNASGCLNPDYKKGDLMVIEDHINLQNDNPLRGRNYDSFGPRFPDMSRPYDLAMNSKAMAIAEQENITIHSGVYVSVNGPNLETKAEYKFLRMIGADVVGMSTVPEVIVANHMQIPVFAISVITDEGFPEILKPVSLAEIVAIAQKAEPKMTTIIKKLIAVV
jgi:purine-nucleoside phosphorylase